MPRTSGDQSLVVTGLAEDLPVATAATTSRSVVDNDQARVIAFTFDTGEELTEHTAAMPVVVQVITGALHFEVAGGAHRLAPGDTVYLAAREPHSLRALEPTLMTLVMVRAGS